MTRNMRVNVVHEKETNTGKEHEHIEHTIKGQYLSEKSTLNLTMHCFVWIILFYNYMVYVCIDPVSYSRNFIHDKAIYCVEILNIAAKKAITNTTKQAFSTKLLHHPNHFSRNWPKDVHCWTEASPKDLHIDRSCAAIIQNYFITAKYNVFII